MIGNNCILRLIQYMVGKGYSVTLHCDNEGATCEAKSQEEGIRIFKASRSIIRSVALALNDVAKEVYYITLNRKRDATKKDK